MIAANTFEFFLEDGEDMGEGYDGLVLGRMNWAQVNGFSGGLEFLVIIFSLRKEHTILELASCWYCVMYKYCSLVWDRESRLDLGDGSFFMLKRARF